ncbi:hypothetical protein BGZ67_007073 [Mortierella alpina]|nr:hypothetical protein BGZ67_007073 [Mortierella alpina]
MDLEAIEDQQLQRSRGHQLSLRPHSGPTVHSDLGFQDLEEHYSTLEETMGSGRLKGGTEDQHAPANNSAVASRISPLPFELTDVNELNRNSAHHHTQPALPLFNSAAGLLDLDQDDGHLLQKPPSLGLACALPSQRRGSQGSLETIGSNYSSSSGTANSASLPAAQTCNNVSGTGAGGGSALHPLVDASSGGGGDGGGGSRGSLMAGAIGALKKKASFSGLAHALGTTATSLAAHHHRQQPSQASSNQSRVDVRKLKDFVIRVPITVVIQVDEHGRAAGAHGTTGSCNDVRCEDIGQKDVASTLLRRSHATHEETSASGSAATINLATPARSVVIEPSARMREPKFTSALESTEALSCLSKIAAPMRASSNLTRSDEVVASPSVLHWHDGLWPEQENDQHVSSLEHADEQFSDDFIVVDAEEVDGDEL